MLGYEKKESIYLTPEHMGGIFNLSGIVMAQLLINGIAVRKWKKKGDTLTISPFREMSPIELKCAKEKADSLWNNLKKLVIS